MWTRNREIRKKWQVHDKKYLFADEDFVIIQNTESATSFDINQIFRRQLFTALDSVLRM